MKQLYFFGTVLLCSAILTVFGCESRKQKSGNDSESGDTATLGVDSESSSVAVNDSATSSDTAGAIRDTVSDSTIDTSSILEVGDSATSSDTAWVESDTATSNDTSGLLDENAQPKYCDVYCKQVDGCGLLEGDWDDDDISLDDCIEACSTRFKELRGVAPTCVPPLNEQYRCLSEATCEGLQEYIYFLTLDYPCEAEEWAFWECEEVEIGDTDTLEEEDPCDAYTESERCGHGFDDEGNLDNETFINEFGMHQLDNCKCFRGGLEIGGIDDISEFLTSVELPNVEMINGPLSIEHNPVLETVSLPNLKRVAGDFSLYSNDVLVQVSLPALEEIDGYLEIKRNPLLEVLNMSALRGIQELTVENNSALADLHGLGSIETFLDFGSSDIVIVNNSSLKNIDAIGKISRFDGKLVIQNNDSLEDISALSQLPTSKWYPIDRVEINDNPLLPTCSALEILTVANPTITPVCIINNKQDSCDNEQSGC